MTAGAESWLYGRWIVFATARLPYWIVNTICKPGGKGGHARGEYIKALYQRAAEQRRPMPKMTPEVLGHWGGEFFLFPNFLVLPNAGNCEFYRSRPDGNNPDSCIFEVYSSKTYPVAGGGPGWGRPNGLRATQHAVYDLRLPKKTSL